MSAAAGRGERDDRVGAASELPATDEAAIDDLLAAVLALRRLADRVESNAVQRAIDSGWTWAEVAEALGVTAQAVHKKHAKGR